MSIGKKAADGTCISELGTASVKLETATCGGQTIEMEKSHVFSHSEVFVASSRMQRKCVKDGTQGAELH